MNQISSLKEHELERLMALSILGIDYYQPNQGLDFLTELAAKVTGTEISLVNLIDTFTQWSVSSYGVDNKQLPKEESICQYTIQDDYQNGLEVEDLSADKRFSDLFYVKDSPKLRYYMGVPLTSPEGYTLGTLCVMDSNLMRLSQDAKDTLKMIAKQVVDRLIMNSLVSSLKNKVKESELNQKKLAHDIRGPIGGIHGLSALILDEQDPLDREEIMKYAEMIKQSSSTLLDLSKVILSTGFDEKSNRTNLLKEDETNLVQLKQTIFSLLTPQIKIKKIDLKVSIGEGNQHVPFSKLYVLQILGNLLSNSIKFTEPGGEILVEMNLERVNLDWILKLLVKDNGTGMGYSKINEILEDGTSTNQGTQGEEGFGIGLNLVRQLVNRQKGTIGLDSELGKGTKFKIEMKVN